jgi:hypothetical protein
MKRLKDGDHKACIRRVGFTIEGVINQAKDYDIIVLAQ